MKIAIAKQVIALCVQTQIKKNLKSVASQRFLSFSYCFCEIGKEPPADFLSP
jgi:hypothetical protein